MGKFRFKRQYNEAIAVYQNLSQDNISKAQALRQAQLDFIQGKLTAKDITDRTGARRSVKGQQPVDSLAYPYY